MAWQITDVFVIMIILCSLGRQLYCMQTLYFRRIRVVVLVIGFPKCTLGYYCSDCISWSKPLYRVTRNASISKLAFLETFLAIFIHFICVHCHHDFEISSFRGSACKPLVSIRRQVLHKRVFHQRDIRERKWQTEGDSILTIQKIDKKKSRRDLMKYPL